jgi:aldehyde:ferredoxin oxidoreductase
VNDLEALTYANFLCNEDGFDPISFGATVGAVMELYEMQVLTSKEIGIEAPFGSAKALTYLAEMTAKGEDFGKEVGLPKRLLKEAAKTGPTKGKVNDLGKRRYAVFVYAAGQQIR